MFSITTLTFGINFYGYLKYLKVYKVALGQESFKNYATCVYIKNFFAFTAILSYHHHAKLDLNHTPTRCSSSQYFDSNSSSCKACHPYCDGCSGSGNSVCTNCASDKLHV